MLTDTVVEAMELTEGEQVISFYFCLLYLDVKLNYFFI